MPESVSILIPCFNCAPWVHRAIETALAQTWPEKEVIVLDDGSTDESLEIIRQYSAGVTLSAQPNRGQNAARNRLMELSRGRWLVFLDADDELDRDSVRRKMVCRSAADAVYGSMEVTAFDGRKRCDSYLVPAREHADLLGAAFQWRLPNTSAFLFKREAIEEAGYWNESLKNCTDYALYFKMLESGARFKAAPDALSLYRQWSPKQAVNEDPLRRMCTRLEVMWSAVRSLEAACAMTPSRRRAFQNAALRVVRTMYTYDSYLAEREHNRLLSLKPDFRPSKGDFTKLYVLAYRALGFAVAERFAAAKRTMVRRVRELLSFQH